MDAKAYNEYNESHFKFAKILLQLIDKYDEKGKYENVIDIGSGTGNITQFLAAQIEHAKIYGIDVDPNMIGFAEQSLKTDNIQYIMTDLSGEWNSIDPKIKRLEGKVSMIFSNMCISLIREKSIFVENLKKLMSNGARAYFSVFLYPDINIKLEGKSKEEFGCFVEIPSFERQMQIWNNLFEDNQISVDFQDIQTTEWLHKKDHMKVTPRFVKLILDLYLKNGMKFDELSDRIQFALTTLLLDQMTNPDDNDINWEVVEEMNPNNPSDILRLNQDQFIKIKYTIGYFVCKFNV